MSVIDARGLSCPQPVLLAKQALDAQNSSEIKVLVDDQGISQNITALAKKYQWESSQTKLPGCIEVTLTKRHG